MLSLTRKKGVGLKNTTQAIFYLIQSIVFQHRTQGGSHSLPVRNNQEQAHTKIYENNEEKNVIASTKFI